MHENEMRADAALVAALIGQQAPQWAELAVTPLPAEVEGTDHVLFRVGPDLLARMPKIDWAVEQGA
ncbi:MAG: phosphotransferase, partial [Tetrasphaera sp.]|nr:phosphotransferase [Tetrasphaera sp.]HRW00866.1 phosphotransferase [Tetrasphaera sp.]